MAKVAIDFTFKNLEAPLVRELKKRRTLETDKNLCRLFAPIWECYINYWLYKFGVYDNDPDKKDLFSETFISCINVLPRLNEHNFNRVKRYYNKCIEGWLRNRIYKIKKKQVEVIKNNDVLKTIPEKAYDIEEVEFDADMEVVEEHFKQESSIFVELYYTVFVGRPREEFVRARDLFHNALCEGYLRNGELTTAEEYMSKRIGAVFVGAHG